MASCVTMKSGTYEETVARWTSYKDVDNWMKANFSFDYQRAKMSLGTRLQPRTPDQTFKLKSGICHDAAVFARDTLNRIDPKYDARVLFIKNSLGNTSSGFFQHHVTVFTIDGKLYIMDYGAGKVWQAMNGIHGPYDSLHGYVEFLSSRQWFQFKVGPMKYVDAF